MTSQSISLAHGTGMQKVIKLQQNLLQTILGSEVPLNNKKWTLKGEG